MEDKRESGWLRVNSALRPVALLGLASVIAGALVGGVGGRVVMTVAARAAGSEFTGRLTENGNVIGQFTMGGTIALVVFVGILGGMLGSIGVVAAEPWLRWMGAFRGLGYGVVVLAIFGYDTFASTDFFVLEPVALDVAMFVVLIVGFGLAVVGIALLLGRWLPQAGEREQPIWLILVALGALPLLLAALFYTSSSFCGCRPAREIGAAVLILIASTAVYVAAEASDAIPDRVARVAKVTGPVSLAVAVALGMARVADNLALLF